VLKQKKAPNPVVLATTAFWYFWLRQWPGMICQSLLTLRTLRVGCEVISDLLYI